MVGAMCHGGKIAMLGIPGGPMAIDWNKVIFSMLTIKGVHSREIYETWYKMKVLLEGGLDIEPVITHRFGADGFEKVKAGCGIKVPEGELVAGCRVFFAVGDVQQQHGSSDPWIPHESHCVL